MKIRLGYACITETLPITTSHTYTYKEYLTNKNLDKLFLTIEKNLLSLKEILIYNIRNNIHFYRISSNLIPLATKEEAIFDYLDIYSNIYNEISQLIEDNNLRVDLHPSEFCVINSVKEDVVKQSINILKYHHSLMKYLKITNQVLVLHIGSSVFGKTNSLTRFCNVFKKLPNELKSVIAIENDDKIFNVDDCIEIYKRLNIPIVFDYHHHFCNPSKSTFDQFMPIVLKSWHNKIPKIHFSSPRGKAKNNIRSHADYINSKAFIDFVNELKKYNTSVDIMIEAKKKDEALFRLVRELKYYSLFTFIDETSFFVN